MNRSLFPFLVSSILFACAVPARDETFGPPIPDVPGCVTQDLGKLVLPAPVDYLALRVDVPYDGPGELTPYTVLASTGEPCQTPESGCYRALDAVRSAGFPSSSGAVGAYLVYTRRAEIGVIDSPDALLAFLGTIDTPEEAMLLATLTAAGPSNDGYYACASDAWADGDGFDVVPWTALCGEDRIAEYHVTGDGVVTELAEHESDGCPIFFPVF